MDARSFLGNCDTVLIRVYCRFHVLLWIMFCSIVLFFSELVLKLMLCVLIGINLNIVGSLVHLFILIFHLYSCKLILNGSGKNCESFFFPSLIFGHWCLCFNNEDHLKFTPLRFSFACTI